MNNNFYQKYKDLKIEDFIWLIYFLILFGNLYSNKLEEDNLFNKNKTDSKTISLINLTILIIVFFIYLYFFYRSYRDYKNSFYSENERKKQLNALVLVASILFLIAGFISIYVELNSFGDNEIGII